MKVFQNINDKLESSKTSFWLYFATAITIVLLRVSLESLIKRSIGENIIGFRDHFVYLPIFYMDILLLISIVASKIAKIDLIRVFKVFIPFFTVVLISPLINIMLSEKAGTSIAYLYVDRIPYSNFFDFFISFIAFMPLRMYSIGVDIFLVLIGILSFIYMYRKTERILKSVLYVFIIFGIIYFFSLFNVLKYFVNSLFTRYDLFSNTTLNNGVVFILLFFGLLLIIFKRFNTRGFKSFLKKLRWTRIAHYTLLFFFGFYLGLDADLMNLGRINLIDVLALVFSIFFAWVCAATINDIEDIKVDAINEPDRPLVTNDLSINEALIISILGGLLSLASAYIVGYPFALVMLYFIGLSMIYSCPPLKLKRFPIVNQGVIGFASLLTFMQGYILACERTEPWFRNVPFRLMLGAFIIFTLASSIKDIKDREGDKKWNIITIPVIFGPKFSKYVIAFLLLISYNITGVVLEIKSISYYVLATVFAGLSLLAMKLFNSDKYLFFLYFIFAILILVLYL